MDRSGLAPPTPLSCGWHWSLTTTILDRAPRPGEAFRASVYDRISHPIIMTGAGDKAFVSGADISQFEKIRNSADANKEYERMTSGGRQALSNFPKPQIGRAHV